MADEEKLVEAMTRAVGIERCRIGGGTNTDVARAALAAAREAGWRLVPAEPTEAMLTAGAPVCYQAYDGDWAVALSDAGDCYRAMIAAA